MNWFVNKLRSLASWLEARFNSENESSKFKDLAPIDNADEDGVYADAIRFALNKERVSNIALTGPYGSGKSSIIQSFLKSYGKPVLQISLASFVSGADASNGGKVTRQEIERSILQQMLYGADSNKLPFSRFKRIQSPGVGSVFKSLFMLVGILSVWYVLNRQVDIVNGYFFSPVSLSNWKNYLSISIALLFLWVVLHHFYVASFGLSLKSISLKDVEIKPDRDDQESILNRHLDEIIYFFQSTKYDLVVIEDLDRFDDAEIFVTLREINKLVNDNSGVKRSVRFLYALRDDMFANTERTKFFEFIIPVIPIINTSNSIDMVLEQGKRLELEERLDRQFLREVSRYLNDLRLIQNIFNEYSIYVAELEKDEVNLLDPNKLLSVLIYKNVYPKDFEQLHRGEGCLAGILSLQDELVRSVESGYRKEIKDLEAKLEAAESQIPLGIEELRKIYAMALIEKLPQKTESVQLEHVGWVSLRELVNDGVLEQALNVSHLSCMYDRGYNRQYDVKNWQDSVCSDKSYEQREIEVVNKAEASQKIINGEIRDIKLRIASLRTKKLNELLRVNSGNVHGLFNDFGKYGELARFLILEGYLDDSYYQYTTLFHKGRLSPNDNKFLIKVRAYIVPESDFQIDNPKEVIAAMRDEDFGQAYVLNIKLVDTLLGGSYGKQVRRFFEFVSKEFGDCEGFIDSYYSSGRYVPELLVGLSDCWKDFVPTVISSHNNVSHISQLVAKLPESSLAKIGRSYRSFPEFVSNNLPKILSSFPEVEVERIICLGFEVKDFSGIRGYPKIVRSMFDKGLFDPNVSNLEYVYEEILGRGDILPMREKNLTTVLATGNEALIGRIERDFDVYISDVLLKLDGNSKEAVSAIIKVLNCEDLDEDSARQFIESQDNLLPTLEGVPERFLVMLFESVAIEATWENCLFFINAEVFEHGVLLSYLNQESVRESVLNAPIPADDDFIKLRRLIFEANTLSDVGYREYVAALPRTFNYISEILEEGKLRILIEEGKLSFTKEVFDSLNDHWDLQLLFVERNITIYLQDPKVLNLGDDFLEDLLRTGINREDKLLIVKLMDLSSLVNFPERAGIIGAILSADDVDFPDIDASVARSLVVNSSPISAKVTLFNRCHSIMTKIQIQDVLANLPKPYCEIKTGHSSPRLDNTSENVELVEWLNSRDIISSWSHQTGFFSGDYIRVNLYRK